MKTINVPVVVEVEDSVPSDEVMQIIARMVEDVQQADGYHRATVEGYDGVETSMVDDLLQSIDEEDIDQASEFADRVTDE